MRARTSGRRATWARATRCSSGSQTTSSTSSAASCPCASASASTGTPTSPASRTRSQLFTPPARPTRGPCCATPAGPSGSPTPAAAARTETSRLDDGRWATLVDGVARAAEHAREAGYEPVFHHHTSSYVEGLPEIERFLEDTEVDLLLDSGHLAVAGGDPIQGLKDWRERVGVVHLKDTRMDVLAAGPPGARRHDQRLAPRPLLRARGRRRRPRRLLRRAADGGTTGGW